MQEEQTVSFDPLSICYYQPPWYETLFLIYLLALVVMLAIRTIRLLIALKKLRAMRTADSPEQNRFQDIWDQNLSRARSLSRFAVLTFLLALLICSISVAEGLSGMRGEDMHATGWLIYRLTDPIACFAMAMLVCTLLYAGGFFFEWRLNHHNVILDRAQGTQASLTSSEPKV